MKKSKLRGIRRTSFVELVRQLKQLSKKTKKPVWNRLAKDLTKSRRQRKKITINLFKLDMFSEKFKNKTFVVPGKVLGTGKMKNKTKVIAVEFSSTALKKINSNGTAIPLNKFIEQNDFEKNLMIVR